MTVWPMSIETGYLSNTKIHHQMRRNIILALLFFVATQISFLLTDWIFDTPILWYYNLSMGAVSSIIVYVILNDTEI